MTQNGDEALLPHGITCLHIAACSPDTTALGALLDTAPDLEAQTHHGYTPLHAAAYAGQLDAISALLCKGAHIEAPNSNLKIGCRKRQVGRLTHPSLIFFDSIRLILIL